VEKDVMFLGVTCSSNLIKRSTCFVVGKIFVTVVEFPRSQQRVYYPTYIGILEGEWKGLRDCEK
jgi:hypothetical protein